MSLDVVSRLMCHLWSLAGADRPLFLNVDRQGGRMHYRETLQRLMPEASLKILDETDANSAYGLADGSRTATISFTVDCEQQHMSVALASMISKYLRELFMTLLNRFWLRHLPDIKPTAGYYADGTRYLREILPVAEQMGIAASWVRRER